MENQKESCLIIFQDAKHLNMIIHIYKEKLRGKYRIDIEPNTRHKNDDLNSRHKIVCCACEDCRKKFNSIQDSAKASGVFSGISCFDELYRVSTIVILLDSLKDVENQLESLIGFKIKHIVVLEKDRLNDPSYWWQIYPHKFTSVLKNLGFKLKP